MKLSTKQARIAVEFKHAINSYYSDPKFRPPSIRSIQCLKRTIELNSRSTVSINSITTRTMGSLPKTSVVVAMGLLLLLLPLVYCDRSVQIELFMDRNCTDLPGIPDYSTGYSDFNQTSNVTFPANPFNLSQPFDFQSAILTNYTGDVLSLVACQVGLPCNASGAIQISFNLSDIGACSTAGPPGTLFDKFLLS